MNTVIRSIRTPRRISDDQINEAKEQIVNALLSDESVFDGEATHSFEDALQFIWAVESSAELIDAELKNIALGKSETIDALKEILTTATENYAEKIAEKVALNNIEDGINHFVENLDVEELQNFRGRV
jgi:hypothetical protein